MGRPMPCVSILDRHRMIPKHEIQRPVNDISKLYQTSPHSNLCIFRNHMVSTAVLKSACGHLLAMTCVYFAVKWDHNSFLVVVCRAKCKQMGHFVNTIAL